jgi:WD40 repeat protein/uncharacterized membrane protein
MAQHAFLDLRGRSVYQQLVGSGCGVLLGAVLFFASFLLLFWNEGRAVRSDRGLREGARSVLPVSDPSRVDPANEGKLVHLTGRADTEEVLADATFGVSEKAIRLARVVEMFQWIEKQEQITTGRTPDFDPETATKYTYRMDWSERLIDSRPFAEEGHTNPPAMRYPGETWTAREVRLGGYVLSPALVSEIGGAEKRPIGKALLEKVPGELRQQLQVRDDSFYLPQTPHQTDQQIGDLRITYQVIRPAEVSILARQVKDSFEPYTTSNGTPVFRLTMGEQSAAAMFETLAAENTELTWGLRLVGFLLMALGIALCFQPVVAAADLVPFLGNLVGGGVLLFAAGMAFLLTLCTIAVAWMTYRPVVAVPLLGVAAVGAYGLYRLGRTGRGDRAPGRRRRKRRPRFDDAAPELPPARRAGDPPSAPVGAAFRPRAPGAPPSYEKEETMSSSPKRRKKKAGKKRRSVPVLVLAVAGAAVLVLVLSCAGIAWWHYASAARRLADTAELADPARQPDLEPKAVVGFYLHAKNPKCRILVGQEGDIKIEEIDRVFNGQGEGQYTIHGHTLTVKGAGSTIINDESFGDDAVLRVMGSRLIHPKIGAFVKQPSPWTAVKEPEKPLAELRGAGPCGTAALLVLAGKDGAPVRATAVSADGSTVVGSTVAPGQPQRPVRWTKKSGFIDLHWPETGLFGSGVARAVSSDGSVVVGDAYVPSWDGEAARFTELGTLWLVPRKERKATGSGIRFLVAGSRQSTAYAVSADGAVVAGCTTTPSGLQAFRWTQAAGRVGLETRAGPNNQNQSEARGLSSDGAVVVGLFGDLRGAAEPASGDPIRAFFGDLRGAAEPTGRDTIRAFRWAQAGGMKELAAAPENNGFVPLAALAVSADGKVVVGVGKHDGAAPPAPGAVPLAPPGLGGVPVAPAVREAFRWTEAGGAVPLGDLPDGDGTSAAEAVAADGSVAGGWSAGHGTDRRAVLWEAATGMHDLQAALVHDYGLNLDGWKLQAVHGISADGRTLVGTAVQAGDLARQQADAWKTWIATLTPSGKELFSRETVIPRAIPRKEATAPPPSLRLTSSGPSALKGHRSPVWSLAFAPDGKTLATGGKDGVVKVWEVATAKEQASFDKNPFSAKALAFSPDGRLLAVCGGDIDNLAAPGKVKLWDVVSRKEGARVEGHAGMVNAAAFAPDGQTLATGSFDGTVKVWDVKTGKELRSLPHPPGGVTSLAISANGSPLAAGLGTGPVRLWEGRPPGSERSTLKGDPSVVNALAFTRDGRTLAAGCSDRSVRLWDTLTGELRATLKGHAGPVVSVDYSPDGKLLASGCTDGTVKLWDAGTGRERGTFTHLPWNTAVTFRAADKLLIATGSEEGTVSVWKVDVTAD